MAYEALHSIKTRHRFKIGSMAIKLDIWKAYDRVKWKFLEAMMHLLGFTKRWISMIMTYVTSTSYSILLNGQP